MNLLKLGVAGPSLKISVEMSCTFSLTPCFLSRLLLSKTIHVPNKAASTAPVAPNAAVVAKGGIYSGASFCWKMFDETTPIRLANGTPTGLVGDIVVVFETY